MNQRLAKGREYHDRDSLRSIARCVAERQIAMLIKEDASEPVSLEIEVPGKYVYQDIASFREYFQDSNLFDKLLKVGIIEGENDDPNYLKFSLPIESEEKLLEFLYQVGFNAGDETIREISKYGNNNRPQLNQKMMNKSLRRDLSNMLH